jgi:hypothetical protein
LPADAQDTELTEASPPTFSLPVPGICAAVPHRPPVWLITNTCWLPALSW